MVIQHRLLAFELIVLRADVVSNLLKVLGRFSAKALLFGSETLLSLLESIKVLFDGGEVRLNLGLNDSLNDRRDFLFKRGPKLRIEHLANNLNQLAFLLLAKSLVARIL